MSEIKVNKISPRTACGTTTLGDSGDSFVFPAGVTITNNGTQTGFGRTGTVDWQTSSIKTATFTAANGEGYFADTSSGGFTMNLPAGTAGNIVSVVDYTNTFQNNALTITPNGSQKIGGIAASFIAGTEGQSLTFVYVDDTEGWKNVQDSTSNAIGNPFLVASGGTITECGNDKIHTFTGPGTFTVNAASATAAENIVSYLVIGGGGGAGSGSGGGGGGGAGGFRELKSPTTPYTASPLDGYPSAPNRVTVTATAYPIVVGGGGAGQPAPSSDSGDGVSGAVSTFSTITSAGGGYGAGQGGGPAAPPTGIGGPGGSGGGGRYSANGGTGNTPPTTPAQGTNGGNSSNSGRRGAGGGGGATVAGTSGTASACGVGGTGTTTSISSSPTAYGGGGGGGGWTGGSPPMPSGLQSTGSSCGTGGQSAGGPTAGENGTTNRGGGGGASGNGGGGSPNVSAGGTGGSGIVVIRYKFQ